MIFPSRLGNKHFYIHINPLQSHEIFAQFFAFFIFPLPAFARGAEVIKYSRKVYVCISARNSLQLATVRIQYAPHFSCGCRCFVAAVDSGAVGYSSSHKNVTIKS